MALQPLAERLRPQSLNEYVGQTHLVGPNGIIRRMIENYAELSSRTIVNVPFGQTGFAIAAEAGAELEEEKLRA